MNIRDWNVGILVTEEEDKKSMLNIVKLKKGGGYVTTLAHKESLTFIDHAKITQHQNFMNLIASTSLSNC